MITLRRTHNHVPDTGQPIPRKKVRHHSKVADNRQFEYIHAVNTNDIVSVVQPECSQTLRSENLPSDSLCFSMVDNICMRLKQGLQDSSSDVADNRQTECRQGINTSDIVSVMQPECSRVSISEIFPSDTWCFGVVDNFCMRLRQGLRDNPAAFKPAIVKMQQNLLCFASSESGLLTTLHTMGKYAGLVPVKWKPSQVMSVQSPQVLLRPNVAGCEASLCFGQT